MSKKFLTALFSLCAPLRVLLCLFLFTGISYAAYNTGQFLSDTNTTNSYTAVTLGPNGTYYGAWKMNDAASAQRIRIATYNGSTWTESAASFAITDVAAQLTGFVNINNLSHEGLAVDTSGNIHIVFNVGATGATGARGIVYGKYSGSAWTFRRLYIFQDPNGFKDVSGGDYSLRLDANQNPHVVLVCTDANDDPIREARLHYAFYNGTSWNVSGNNNAMDAVQIYVTPFNNQEGVADPSATFDSAGNLHVAFLAERSDSLSSDIYYAVKAAGGSTFTTPVVAANVGNATRPSIVVDSSGVVSIADTYLTGTTMNYRLTTNSGGSFNSSIVGTYELTGTTKNRGLAMLGINSTGRRVFGAIGGSHTSGIYVSNQFRIVYETGPGVWAQEAMTGDFTQGPLQNPTMVVRPSDNRVMVLYGQQVTSGNVRTLRYAEGIPTNYGAPPLPNLTINDVTLNEGNAGTTSFTFTASLSAAAPAGGVTFNYATANNTATAGSDYTAVSGTGTIAAGQTSTTITVLGNGDTTVEPDETFFVNLSAANNATITDAQGLGTIINDDTSIALTLPDSSLFEDQVSDFAFTFTRSGNVSGSATANFSYGGTAALTTDYTQSGATTFASGNGTITFGPGETSKIITINPVADNLVEGSETVGLSLNGGTGYNVTGTATQTATIVDDDVNVSVTVSPASVTEDGVSQLVYTFTRSGGPTSNPLVANVNVSGTATPNVDYASSGFTSFNSGTGEATVTFATGSATRVVTIYPSPDSSVEPDETVIVTLAANGTPAVTGGYTVGTPSTATGTILNDDTYVSVQSVSTTSVAENSGTNIVYTFSRTGPTTAALTANLEVQGSAKFPGDFTPSGATIFTATGGTITFAAGSSTTTVTLTLVDDEIVENNETINVNVTSGSGYAASGTSPTVTITDNDTATLTLAKINDGNEDGPVPALFRFSLSAPASTSVTIDYNFLGTASSGDYTSPGSSVTIAPGETSVDVSVPIVDDSTAEGTETLTLNAVSVLKSSLAITTTLPMFATADIIDNDKAVSIAAVTTSANEGTGAGTTPFTFTVSRNGPTIGAVSMTYTVSGSGGNPANAADFGGSFPTGTVTIPAGSASVPLTINVSRDSTRESNEDFTVTLSGPDNGYILSTATASATITNDDFEADLAITATDGVTTAVPGNSVTYTITVSNAGPDPVIGATVLDTFPAPLTANWTAVGAAGGTVASSSGAGNINTTVNLPVGGSVTFTASATINASATGTISNTATIAAPAGTTDLNPGNNSATDTDTLTPQANLSVTVTDGVTSATPGGSVTYTIVVSNAGPSNAPGATVADTFPAALTATWTGIGAGGGTVTAAGSGNINDTVNLPAGGSVTYTVSATISPSATGTLVNTATVAAPSGVTDPTPGNNSATDTDTLTPSADLAITITDGVTTATPGGTVTYTITASNAGPSNAPGATVACTFPAALTTTWIGATGGGTVIAAGSGNINGTVNLPAGGSVTYTVTANISPSATGTLSTTATVAAPAGVTDPTPGNNSGTDTDTLNPTADLAITITDGVTSTVAGSNLTYTIVVSNNGPSTASGVTVADTFPAALTNVTWTGVGAGGGTATASGSGNINDTINLPSGGSATYTVSATLSPTATGTLTNTATVAAPAGVTDPTPANNSATDTDTINVQADISVTLTDSPDPVQAGENVTYTVTLINNGPSSAQNPTVSMVIPSGMTFVSADQVIPGQGWGDDLTTPPVGSGGTITITPGNFGVGQKAYTIVCKVGYVGNGTVLSMTATASSATTDPTPGNNSATATTTVSAAPEIALHNGGSTIDAPITDGQATAINFGTTNVNAALITRSFTIANTGNDTLSVSAVAVPTGFSLVNPFTAQQIAPNASFSFQVRYDAAAIGTVNGDIVIANNDADEAPFNFPITATRENVAPVAVTQDLTIEEDEVKAIVLTGNDADDQPITFTIIDQPQHGTLTGTAPNVTYTPNADYNGTDVFTFKVNDGTADSAEKEINLTITPVNDAPKVVGTGIPDQTQIRPDVARTIDLTPYFSDAETASANLIYTVNAPVEAQAVVTGSSLVINGSVSGAFDITINAADSDTLNVSDTFTLTVKRVPQLAGAGVPPTLVSPSEPSFDLDLAGYFTDGDGDSLGYAITNNTDSGVLTATISGSTVTIVPVTPGVASLTIRVTDTDGNFIDHTFEVTIDDPVPDSVPTVTSPPKLNRQTGLWEISLTATNNNQFNVPGFRFRVTSVLPSHIRLYNSTAPIGSGESYLDVLNVLTPGQSITIVLEFHSTTRNFAGFDPTIIAEPLPEGTSNAGDGVGMEINRFVNLADGSKLIEFSSIAGRWYEIQYSADLVTWKRSLVPVQAGANFTQWIDRGAPYTESHPSTVPQRFYRVSEILPD